MPISQLGAINTTALIVPDLYIQIVPPSVLNLNGVPTNVMGVVGTASWGPKNIATILGSMADYATNFGAVQARKYDAGTAIAAAVQQGASNFRMVRVTDGTDTAAASTGVSTCITFTALYTGSLGNSLVATLTAGRTTGTWTLTVGLPGLPPEIYPNVAGTGNAFWVALAAAVNTGQSAQRGPSNLITATASSGSTAATAITYPAFTAGTDGVATLTASVLVGTDGVARTGMYALRGQGCSIGVLADADDSTQWTTIDALGLSEGIYMIQVLPAGTTAAAAVTAIQGAGLSDYATKLMHGDWIWWNDQANNVLRLISPQGFVAGLLANLSPQNSTLNKTLFGVVGSQKSALSAAQNGVYSAADLQVLFQAGIDVIANPGPGGNPIWTVRGGINTSGNPGENGDNYTRMTNYIAATLAAGMGLYVGQLMNLAWFQNVSATLSSFFAGMLQQGLLNVTLAGGLPYAVVCNLSNNPASRTGLGYGQADCQVMYTPINRFFIVNVEGGQTVTVSQTTPAQ